MKTTFRCVMAVFYFEWMRTLTVPRIFAWSVLVFFPVFLVAVIRLLGGGEIESSVISPQQFWGLMLFFLIPEVVCLLGLLLWATPIVYSELEGKTWIYLAVRPQGKFSVVLGKYLTAVSWTGMAGWVSVSLSMLIALPSNFMRMWFALSCMVLFSCVCYGALYTFLGVFFQRRATVVAVAYTLIFEVLVAFIPAMINQLTVQYRLRSMFATWMNWDTLMVGGEASDEIAFVFGTEPTWQHLLGLLTYTLVMMTATWITLRSTEFVTAEES